METNEIQYSQNSEQTAYSGQGERQRYKLSSEEMRALNECNRESFYYRSMPLAAASMIAVHLATKRGLLTSHPKWGSTFKLLGAGFAGWFVGKVSYQNKCAEKLMQLPNSQLGETLRRRRLGQEPNQESYIAPLEQISPESKPSDSVRTEYSARDLFPTKDASPEGLDDSFRPSVDNPQATPEVPEQSLAPPPLPQTTYEDLRKRNRESTVPQPSGSYPVYVSPSPSRSAPRKETTHDNQRDKSKNLYGDEWDN